MYFVIWLGFFLFYAGVQSQNIPVNAGNTDASAAKYDPGSRRVHEELALPQLQSDSDNRRKRARREIGDLHDLNEILEDLQENGIQARAAAAEVDPRMLVFLIMKLKQMQKELTAPIKTPRVGRNLDIELREDDENSKQPYWQRLNKKSVPYKPRLGRRSSLCDYS